MGPSLQFVEFLKKYVLNRVFVLSGRKFYDFFGGWQKDRVVHVVVTAPDSAHEQRSANCVRNKVCYGRAESKDHRERRRVEQRWKGLTEQCGTFTHSVFSIYFVVVFD